MRFTAVPLSTLVGFLAVYPFLAGPASRATAGPAPATAVSEPAPFAVGAFAAAIAIDEGRIYVGAPGEMPEFPMPSNWPGALHVFERAAAGVGEWELVASVTPPDVEAGDRFGAAVAASGDFVAVGAPAFGGGGAVDLLERQGDEWVRVGRLTVERGGEDQEFGAAVALEGDWLLVGAPGSDDGAGAAHAFRRQGGSWVPAGVLRGEVENGRLGAAVALDAAVGRAAIGAPGPMPAGFPVPNAPQPQAGAVHVVDLVQMDQQATTLTPADPAPGMFGHALALDGDVLYASQPLQGQVLRYERRGTDWQLAGTLGNPGQGNTGFGASLALAGSDVLVSAPASAQMGGANQIHVFSPDGAGGWEASRLTGPPGDAMQMFGVGLAASDRLAVAGSPGGDIFEGYARVFERGPGDEWRPDGVALEAASPPLPAVTGEPRRCEGGEAEGRPCQGVDMLAFLPVHELGGERGVIVNDLWGWTDSETGREYALVGRSDGLVFVDITEPSSPRVLGEMPLPADATESLWRDMKVYADHAFVVADGAGEHGMQVFDLRRLRGLTGPPVTFEADAHYDGIASAHNIVIDTEAGLAAVVGASGGGQTCGGGLHLIDITEPASPTYAGCFTDPNTAIGGTGYSHDAQCVTYRGPDTRFTGRHICLGSNENALSVADVTDPENPVALAAATYPNSGYLHQGWLSEDHRYFYMNDETDELAALTPRTRTLVWDLTQLDDPILVTEHLGTTAASDHNLYVRGDTMYQANYVSGLRLLDISDPENPREVGFFDTVPGGEDKPGFAGAWSVYPFFRSGTLIVSSMREGLFILKAQPKPVS